MIYRLKVFLTLFGKPKLKESHGAKKQEQHQATGSTHERETQRDGMEVRLVVHVQSASGTPAPGILTIPTSWITLFV